MSKLTVAVIFGGQSSEHIVSCMSAANVIEHIDRTRYNVLLVGITEEGHWIKADSLDDVKTGAWRGGTVTALLSPDATRKCMILMDGDKIEEVKLDVVFPVLHGLYGEDGTIQGLLELARIPYVGCGVLASAVSMDKLYTKIIVSDLGIRQAEYEAVNAAQQQAELEADEARRQAEYEEDLIRRQQEMEDQRRYEYEAEDEADAEPEEPEEEEDERIERIPDDGSEMDVEEFAQYACKYAAEIDCSISGKSMLALYERAEMMEEDGVPLTKANAEDLIEEAADKAEKRSFGGMFSSKYDKDGLLILKEKHFFD